MTTVDQIRANPGTERASSQKPIGVIDIGSNSVRLVVFDGAGRVPMPLFNEKTLCGLGRGLDRSGQLNPDGVVLALECIDRFVGLAEAMDVEHLELLATAAVREARNGDAFVGEVEEGAGRPVRILSGEEEARLAAQGVLAGLPSANGVTGDLGGGSLELVSLSEGAIGSGATLPLGPLRLIDQVGVDRAAASALIESHLERLAWLPRLAGTTFYPVGGAWRAFVRIHMEQIDYPLHMVHGYCMTRRDAEELSDLISRQGRRSLMRIPAMPRRRLDTLPFAALLLHWVLQIAQPERVVFSAYGLREGWLFDRLTEQEKARDPLLAAAKDWAARDARFDDLGQAIIDWTAPLFPEESATAHRVRMGACHLSDVGWRYHPDYRAEQMMLRVLRAQELCIEHHERAFIAMTLFTRYGGRAADAEAMPVAALLKPKKLRRAQVLGAALRLAYAMSGGTLEMLVGSRLRYQDEELSLTLPPGAVVPAGQTLQRRLQILADYLGARQARVIE